MPGNSEPPPSPHYPRCYRALAPGFIRVFELEAGSPTDPVIGRLVPQRIEGEAYEAVSYVWGDPRNRHDLTVDGNILSVTENLHGALTAFRHLPSECSNGVRQPVRRVWADALCINQENVPERTAQLELMGPIFAGARRVLAWVGWEEGEEGRRHTQDAIRFIHFFMGNPDQELREARILLLHHDVSVTGPASRLALLSDDDKRLFEDQATKWEAVKIFFDIEYFHRAWIVQELGLAQEAILYTALKPPDGDGSATDSDATKAYNDSAKDHKNAMKGAEDAAESVENAVHGHKDAVKGVKNATQRLENSEEDHDLELDTIDWPLVGRFAHFLDYRAASLVTHLDLKSWVAHHILMVWETNSDGSPRCDFLTAMHWVRILGVTDARDRVYSLLGHPCAVMDGHLVIKPDYTVTRGVVYTRLAANFIRKTKSLQAVNLVDHEEDPYEGERRWDPKDESRMPSWVPDWHSINRTTPMDWPGDSIDIGSGIEVGEGVEGVEGTSLPHLLVKGWVMDEIAAVSARMETTDFPVTNLVRERAKVNPFWLDRVWEMVSSGSASCDDSLALLESLSLALPLGTREKGEQASTVGPQQTQLEHQRSFAAYVLQYHELRRGVTEAYTDGYLPERSLLDTLPADDQAKLRRRAEGATSGGFLECMTWPSMCRVVYRTKLGSVGMGSRITRSGDLVCRVCGSNVLMTLRRVGHPRAGEDVVCVFVAPTVVPACMQKRESEEDIVRFRIR
ncbi:heterokaryon incompatibility protein-domain-containing protein [Podospora aff. communis PSN243]|uniref:Heterokaryon incompatibility protein-domain-containing protein n=1 Tax=Podospora aff. communis PSN243 TaxID=3040156 RepID=A0AAV9GGH9_9PEZI|nr:heterokaryon incompatibility protein-domain-containing protein [Podospora aff. communis PSN243]